MIGFKKRGTKPAEPQPTCPALAKEELSSCDMQYYITFLEKFCDKHLENNWGIGNNCSAHKNIYFDITIRFILFQGPFNVILTLNALLRVHAKITEITNHSNCQQRRLSGILMY